MKVHRRWKLTHQKFSLAIETVAKKVDWPKISLIIKKNPQFLSNQADIKAILPTHELVIFIKFHIYWMKLMDFFIFGLFSKQENFFTY